MCHIWTFFWLWEETSLIVQSNHRVNPNSILILNTFFTHMNFLCAIDYSKSKENSCINPAIMWMPMVCILLYNLLFLYSCELSLCHWLWTKASLIVSYKPSHGLSPNYILLKNTHSYELSVIHWLWVTASLNPSAQPSLEFQWIFIHTG